MQNEILEQQNTDHGESRRWQALVPPQKQESVAKALRAIFGTTDIEDVSPLTGGGSTALVLRIVVDARSYVLRILMQINALNDPVRQFACLKTAADAGISPRVHYADTKEAISLTDYIAAVPLQEYADLTGFPLLIGVTNAIKAIQSTPAFPSLVNYLDGIDGFIQAFRASGMLPEQATRELFELYARIQEAYPRHDPDLVSSHNDLNPRNILFDGKRLWIIDWDTAFRNDRYADLANVANFFFRDEPDTGEPGAEEEMLLRAYFDNALDEDRRARFFLMRQVGHMFYAMALALMASSGRPPGFAWDQSMQTPRLREFHRQRLVAGAVEADPLASPEGQFLYAKVRLNEALHSMRTPRFERSLHRVQNASW